MFNFQYQIVPVIARSPDVTSGRRSNLKRWAKNCFVPHASLGASCPRNDNRKPGFTILEILTVIAIISALTLIAFPVYRQIAPKLTLDSTIRDVASDLRYAQQLAVAEQVVYKVSFNIPQNNYSIINSASGQTIKSQTINSRILIQQINGLANNTVNFNATGGVTQSGFIVLLNETNNTSTIEIKPSGYVKIK